MSIILLFIATLLPIVYSLYKCVDKCGKIEISFIVTFSIGYLYYSILPMYFGVFNLSLQNIDLSEWFIRYNRIPNFRIIQYLLFIIVVYLVFVFVLEKLFYMLLPKIKSLKMLKLIKNASYDDRYEKYWFIFFIFLGLYSFYRVSGELFSNYDWTNTTNRAVVSAFSMLVLSFTILYFTTHNKKRIIDLIFNPWTILLIITSIILLILGGRLYVMTIVLAYIIYYTYCIKKINLKWIMFFGVFILLIVGVIGITRSGFSNISVFSILDNILVESIYNFFSVIDYLTKYDVALINIPIGLFGAIILLIPSPIFPGKDAIAGFFVNNNYHVESLVGGMNIFPSLNIEFGFIGTVIFLIIIFIFLKGLKEFKHPLTHTIYILFSSNLLFTFFRDPFSISIIKNILQFSIIMPVFFYFFPKVYMVVYKKVNVLIKK